MCVKTWFSTAMLGVSALTTSPLALACDGVPVVKAMPAQPSITVTIPAVVVNETSVSNVEQLLAQLEALVEPVCDRVSQCNGELLDAQSVVESINNKLSCVTGDQAKTLRSLTMLKEVLGQPGCTVKIGDRVYDREAIGTAIQVKLSAYRSQDSTIKSLSAELMAARQNLDKVAAKVARWVTKEKELLAQIESIEASQAKAVTDVAKVSEKVTTLTVSVKRMLSPAEANAATTVRPLSAAEAKLVAEVDHALSKKEW
ncbi:MAG: hypothetical protein IT423_12625 [Pirellulaceae bacterium]|nr:hypothetical protein [Pirellulaceae bacterium]